MDITLERIFSLLPHKPDGRIVRGSKTELARALGYDSGDIVTMWVNGSSASYKKRLSDIALMYGVSVEWLKGETDDPTPGENAESAARQLDRLIGSMSREELQALIVRASELLRDK